MAGKIITINHLRIKAWEAHVLEGLHLTVGEEDMETMEIMETMGTMETMVHLLEDPLRLDNSSNNSMMIGGEWIIKAQ